MAHELTQKLAAAVDGMPAFPRSVRLILALTKDVDCTPKDIIQIIDKDPVLTLRVLKVVNSAYYGLARPITTVSQAVVYLGFNTIKNLALSIAAIGMLPERNDAGFDPQQYLLHSLSTAGLARQLATHTGVADPFDSFIAGLLHDFGKVVLAQFMPEDFRMALELSAEHGLSLHLALQKIIGVDHASIGAVLVEKWHFSKTLADAIRHQHGDIVPGNGLVACVFAANQASKQLRWGFAGNTLIEPLPPAYAELLGGDLTQLIERLDPLDAIFAEALAFAQIEGEGESNT